MTDLELLWAIDKYLPDKYLPLFHEMEKQAAAAPDLLAALQEIAKGEGAFSLDPLTFANNTIENMKEIANTAIAKAETT